ncbi:Lin1 family protein [Aspergillus steynii IBT 23096]|uniref:Lin1 family protein n=1 Tax=Aspergillus steynii IBT 23096 TaxID=1392250 RepID=A0A2I2FX92_9EURO|nr:Lin1 family protein [Aspergillus steynii IBT 23096]PLB45232.1 Lin1 family protein [Aspergillus steynii IBT 23096]
MSGFQPRPKRAGEDFTRTHHEEEDATGTSSKKPRFDLRNPSTLAPDALDDDVVLDADEIGRRGQQVRRKAVNLDGYDSDSDNEGFDARSEAKAKASRAKQEADEDDMFAELQEDFGAEEVDGDEAMRKNKKNVRFLRDDEIEGQVAGSKGGGTLHADLSRGAGEVDVDEEESESEIGEEERAQVDGEMDEELGAGSKKKHAPLLDAFNMKTEQEEGKFDDQGNYIRKAVDPDAVYDTWLEGVSKKDMRRAKEAAEKRETERKEKDRASDSVLASDVLKTLIVHLKRGETILEALARIGKGAPKKPKWQNNRNKNRSKQKQTAAEDADMTEDDPNETARKKAIDDITGAADILMTRGQADIYDTERELLTRQYRRETGDEWIDPPEEDPASTGDAQSPAMWQFRWSDARDGGIVHGPYDSATMESWKHAGYFGEGVEFRQTTDTGEWRRDVDFTSQ